MKSRRHYIEEVDIKKKNDCDILIISGWACTDSYQEYDHFQIIKNNQNIIDCKCEKKHRKDVHKRYRKIGNEKEMGFNVSANIGVLSASDLFELIGVSGDHEECIWTSTGKQIESILDKRSSVQNYFDFLNIYTQGNDHLILASGWCFDTKRGIPQINISVNGKILEDAGEHLGRVDVCRRFGLTGRKYEKCGFRIKKHVAGKIESLKIIAHFEDKDVIISSKRATGLKKIVKESTIAFDLQEVKRNSETGIYHFYGWFTSLKDEKNVEISIEDSQGNLMKSVIRTNFRKDVCTFLDLKECIGFDISFKSEKNMKYNIVFQTDNEKYIESINKYEIDSGMNFLKLIKRINRASLAKGINYISQNGVVEAYKWLKNIDGADRTYQNWFDRHSVSEEQLEKQKHVIFTYMPLISIIVPTYNTPIKLLKEMIESVRNQSYQKWELCIADGSDNLETKKAIKKYAEADNRIKVTWLDNNYGISGNTNKALELAKGEYISLFDHDDVLELDALFEVVKSLQKERYDIVYTDEDKLNDQTGLLDDPNFKPEWSPDLFCSHNYITHLYTVKSEIMNAVGGFRSEFDGAQDYDLMFRCIELSKSIYHLPKVLYHWRIHEGSTAGDPESKLYAYEAGKKAIQSHLDRINQKGNVEKLDDPLWGLYHVVYDTSKESLVSIIIPSYEHPDVLKKCIDSLYQINNYKNFEIIIVENNSKKKETFDYYEAIQKEHENIHVVVWKGTGFNFSTINNFGVKFAKGEYVLLLNNDTEMIDPDSLREMVGNIQRDEVGIVGAKLLYDDDTVQHAGIVIGFDGYAGHVFTGIMKDEYGYMMRAAISCNYSAVTAACLMTKKTLWDKVEGMDEQFAVACNDVDYCLKIRELDKLVVYDAFSLWHHYESKSRGYEDDSEKQKRYNDEVSRWQKKWNKYLPNNDPYYNKNFAIEKGPYILD